MFRVIFLLQGSLSLNCFYLLFFRINHLSTYPSQLCVTAKEKACPKNKTTTRVFQHGAIVFRSIQIIYFLPYHFEKSNIFPSTNFLCPKSKKTRTARCYERLSIQPKSVPSPALLNMPCHAPANHCKFHRVRFKFACRSTQPYNTL